MTDTRHLVVIYTNLPCLDAFLNALVECYAHIFRAKNKVGSYAAQSTSELRKASRQARYAWLNIPRNMSNAY